ncbi:hypothetical protein [Bacillus sp. Brlt_9]|uniref:hypothetical protein n=1 Tax=Bacillus sp. Brlt_9 TaxID=3110916 RepID=UPI003F7C2C4D
MSQNNGYIYTDEDLKRLEQEQIEYEKTNKGINVKDIFRYLEEHIQFSHIDEESQKDKLSYYFHSTSNGSQLLFMDIPLSNEAVETDDAIIPEEDNWFRELFTFTKKMHQKTFENN